MSDEFILGLDDLPESLIDLACLGLFRSNAFRVVGLTAHVAESEIKQQGEMLKFQAVNGGSVERLQVGPLPLDPSPIEEAIDEALQRLLDPEPRFFDEFFWFWPHPELGSNDPAIAALSNRDIETAIEVWTTEARRRNDRSRSAHNLAVLFHTLALDIEHAKQPETISQKLEEVQYTYWRKGLSQWQAVLADEELWEQLHSRVSEFSDPRLTATSIWQLRTALPLLLLLINAQMVTRAVAFGAVTESQKYRLLLQESGFAKEVAAEACARWTQRIRKDISAICQLASQEADADHAIADVSTRRLLTETQPLLAAIDALLPSDVLGDEVRDEVATAALECLDFLCEQEEKSEVGCELLEMTRPCAISLAVKQRIDSLRTEFLISAYRPKRKRS